MAFIDSWKIERNLTRHHLQFFFLFGAHRLQLALNRGSRWSLTTEACKPLTLSLALAAWNWWSCSAHPKYVCYKVHKSTRRRLLPVSVHSLHGAQGWWRTSVFLCTGASVALQGIVRARCILVLTGPASLALHRSFPGKSPPASDFFFPYKK